jgi:hypothetical protein
MDVAMYVCQYNPSEPTNVFKKNKCIPSLVLKLNEHEHSGNYQNKGNTNTNSLGTPLEGCNTILPQ